MRHINTIPPSTMNVLSLTSFGFEIGDECGKPDDHAQILTKQGRLQLSKIIILIIF
jgi:hypothetical protein